VRNARVILEARGVTKRFGGLTAVDGVSFQTHEHEVMGVIGPNGSGKTTLMNLISGALRATSGAIVMAGKTLTDEPAHRIARLGVARTFQLVRVLPGLSLVDNVVAGAAFGHRPRWSDEARERAEGLLDRVGLGERIGQPVATLTYIDQKRLELARALASEPRVLLLDEWLAGLNPTELRIGIDLIGELRAEGRTILLVEHVMDAIRALCDRCVVMNAGRKIAEGPPAEALADPGVVAAYLGAD
jgi:ABC-type branched-chain amino acid transport systems, ATPase component